jgi:DNA invertase Pin-like site-specific DNA recombinase
MRMSAEHQQAFASDQMDVIREYAKRHGMQIVKEYSDTPSPGARNLTRTAGFMR